MFEAGARWGFSGHQGAPGVRVSECVCKRAVCECLFILGAVAKSGVFASRELPESRVCLLSRVQGGTRGETSAGRTELALVSEARLNGPVLWGLLVLESPPQDPELCVPSSPGALFPTSPPEQGRFACSPPGQLTVFPSCWGSPSCRTLRGRRREKGGTGV